MNEAKQVRLEQGLNGVARRVLEAVPIAEPWTKGQIVSELRRTSHSVETNVIEGCLDTLRGRGLVREPSRGQFQRVTARPKSEHQEDPMPEQTPRVMASAAEQAAAADPLTRMAALAADARRLAAELEDVALDVTARIEATRAETEQLRQLQVLLKNIGLGA